MATIRPSIVRVALGDAFRMAISIVGKTDHVRIYAATSRVISEHMPTREFPTTRLDLLVGAARPDSDPMLDKEVGLSVMYTWTRRVRAGAIGTLAVRQHDFYSTEWFVIFDNRLMIMGTYTYDRDLIGRSDIYPDVFVFMPHGEASGLILAKVDTFDKLFVAAESDFGEGEYEGEYQLHNGVVKRCRKAGGEWEELGAVSQASVA